MFRNRFLIVTFALACYINIGIAFVYFTSGFFKVSGIVFTICLGVGHISHLLYWDAQKEDLFIEFMNDKKNDS